MSRYEMLVRVLDGVRQEAEGSKYADSYAIGSSEIGDIWAARARAYIHLYLKVMFGVRSFTQREHYVTDGGRDGGIDGYYIDNAAKEIYIIQSKFRHTQSNFESKPIELNELLAMQIRRVLNGESFDEQGFDYNGKIKGLQRAISEIYDLGRYKYKVIIIANIKKVSDGEILRLTEGIPYQIFDYERAYNDLLFPVISGSLFKAHGMAITLDLSNKSTGSKIGYTALAAGMECEITVAYVPTIEIGRILSEYRNSILTYNPRSYLEFEGEKVNNSIKESILKRDGNEFALLNNGITIICDESGVNDWSGRKGSAQLFLVNPQIINGGQTAYTLSRIYDNLDEEARKVAFAGKEVLVKAIAVPIESGPPNQSAKRIALIERISTATNSQTVVTTADRGSGDEINVALQNRLFQDYGILYERKRGEFAEGVRDGYVDNDAVVGRAMFARVFLAANGRLSRSRKKRILVQDLGSDVATNIAGLQLTIIGLDSLKVLNDGRRLSSQQSYHSVLPRVRACVIASAHFDCDLREKGAAGANVVVPAWPQFLKWVARTHPERVSRITDYDGNHSILSLKLGRKALDSTLDDLMLDYFSSPEIVLKHDEGVSK